MAFPVEVCLPDAVTRLNTMLGFKPISHRTRFPPHSAQGVSTAARVSLFIQIPHMLKNAVISFNTYQRDKQMHIKLVGYGVDALILNVRYLLFDVLWRQRGPQATLPP